MLTEIKPVNRMGKERDTWKNTGNYGNKMRKGEEK